MMLVKPKRMATKVSFPRAALRFIDAENYYVDGYEIHGVELA
jgi:hypothetical protein